MKNKKLVKKEGFNTSLDYRSRVKLSFLQTKVKGGTTSQVLRLGIDALYEKYQTDELDKILGL